MVVTLVPATLTGIEKYLGSGLIKGIGPSWPRGWSRICEEDTLKVIKEDSGRLLEV